MFDPSPPLTHTGGPWASHTSGVSALLCQASGQVALTYPCYEMLPKIRVCSSPGHYCIRQL